MSFLKNLPMKMNILHNAPEVIYPGCLAFFDILDKDGVKAVEKAYLDCKFLFLSYDEKFDTRTDDNHKIGLVCEIKKIFRVADSRAAGVRVGVTGLYRATVKRVISKTEVEIIEVHNTTGKTSAAELKILHKNVSGNFTEYNKISPKAATKGILSLASVADHGKFADLVAIDISDDRKFKLKILQTKNIASRLKYVAALLTSELEIARVEMRITSQVKSSIERNQKELYLKEQLRVIREELGDDQFSEIDFYVDSIEDLPVDEDTKTKLIKEAYKLYSLHASSPDSAITKNYLETVLALPWAKFTKDRLDIDRARKILDSDHYGLQDVKQRVLEFLAVYKLKSAISGQILCLVGPPGVGKTSIAKSIAKSLNRKFSRISLGGVRDEADIRGHRKTYVASMPGRIIDAVKSADSVNPVILLDEVDKMSQDFKGDPASALLEVLDSAQNSTFRDHYLEIPFDLSNVCFICTANSYYDIPEPLLDRMEVVNLNSYTRLDKFNIAKNHLLKKQIKEHGLKSAQIKIADSALFSLIDEYTREAGVRNLEREIGSLCRKTAMKIVSEKSQKQIISNKNIADFLGAPKYTYEKISKKGEIGLINGLAWTRAGGDLMHIETICMPGTGKISLTGSLGEVMRESANAAISYIRTKAAELKIDADFHKNTDIHIHATEGAVPKDGPSAGVAMALAVISALTQKPLRGDVAFTGEITIRGKVLAIGGSIEKCMAAHKFGIKTVVLPKSNEPNLEKLDNLVKDALEFKFIENMDEVLDFMFGFKKKSVNIGGSAAIGLKKSAKKRAKS